MKKRRQPYATLPPEVANHGYVSDLVHAVTEAAKAHGQPITFHRKNNDWYIAVIIPNKDELAAIDKHTDEATQ